MKLLELLGAMDRERLDALVLGRPANIRYASGVAPLWTAGARPWAPGCVVAHGKVHLMSVIDGPPSVGLFPMTWNPGVLADSLAALLSGSSRVGTDGMTPAAAELLARAVPNAEIVDARDMLWDVRQVKTVEEVALIRRATSIASEGLTAMAEALTADVTERQLLAAFVERAARLGAPILASEAVAFATNRHGPVAVRHVPSDRPIESNQLVVLNPGVLYAGYEGGVGRTVGAATGDPAATELASRCRAGRDALVSECRAGRTGADLRRAWTATGELPPPVPLAYGIGLGVEPPIIDARPHHDVSSGPRRDSGPADDAVLRSGSVLAVQSWVAQTGVGGWFERDLVLVTDGAAEVLI